MDVNLLVSRFTVKLDKFVSRYRDPLASGVGNLVTSAVVKVHYNALKATSMTFRSRGVMGFLV